MAVDPDVAAHVAMKMPPFYTWDPDLWFDTVESSFRVKNIKTQQTKYDYVISSLPTDISEDMSHFIKAVPEEDKYTYIKQALLEAYKPTPDAKCTKLLELPQMQPSDCPRVLARKIVNLSVSMDQLQQALLLRLLPPDLRAAVSTTTAEDVHALGDAVKQAQGRIGLHKRVAALSLGTTPSPSHEEGRETAKSADELEQLVTAAVSKQLGNRGQQRAQKGKGRGKNPSASKGGQLCFPHQKYGRLARSCNRSCPLWTNEAPGNA